MIVRRFDLVRDVDVSGVSGTGKVAHGWRLPGGSVLLTWPGRRRTWTWHVRGVRSVEAIHGHGGATRMVFRCPRGGVSHIADPREREGIRAAGQDAAAGDVRAALDRAHPIPPTRNAG